MFNWFKRHKNTLIPTDINDGIMTNTLCDKGVKFGTKINIPDNVVCFVCYRDKFYYTLDTGTFTLDAKSLQNLIIKQRKKEKTKKLKMDLFFVNKKHFIIDTQYIDRIPVNKKSLKFHFNIKTEISVENAEFFARYLLTDTATLNAEKSLDLFRSYIEGCGRKFFLKIVLKDISLSNEIKQNFEQYLTKFLNKFGVKLHNFDISIASNKIEQKTSFFSFNHQETKQDTENKEKEKILVDQTQEKEYTENNKQYCPNCNMSLIKGTKYCHRCGHEV